MDGKWTYEKLKALEAEMRAAVSTPGASFEAHGAKITFTVHRRPGAPVHEFVVEGNDLYFVSGDIGRASSDFLLVVHRSPA
jgi:hypothetical protein